MELPEIMKTLLAAKKVKDLSFSDLGGIIGRDEVWFILYIDTPQAKAVGFLTHHRGG